MAEYIEREKTVELLRSLGNREYRKENGTIQEAIKMISYPEYTPTADVAPVVHGRWEWFDEETGTPFTGYEREWGWKCSYCGEELPDDYDDPDNRPTFRFCHSCGAKMDGGDSDEAD